MIVLRRIPAVLLLAIVPVVAGCAPEPPPAPTPTPTPTPTPPPIPAPSLEIVSPDDGATLVEGPVTVTIEVTDFVVVAAMGEENVPGEGHIHYYLNAEAPTTSGEPAVTEPGTYAVTTDLSYTWEDVPPGSHTLAVQLVNNDHTPLDPPVVAMVSIEISPEPAETVTIQLEAQNTAFDTESITVPAGAAVTIEFNNRDAIAHNFALYESSAATSAIFVGELITGPGTISYEFIAPETPGTYFFRCDPHPATMTGDFIVSDVQSS